MFPATFSHSSGGGLQIIFLFIYSIGMKGKVILVLLVGIIILIAGSAYLLTRNNLGNNSTQNPVQENVQTQQEGTIRYVEGGSLANGYEMEILNKESLVKALEGINIFGRTYIYTDTQTTGDIPLENILVIVRSSAPAGENLFDDNIYISLSKRTIEIDFVLTDEQLNDPNIQEYILKKLIENVYRLTYKDVDDTKVNEKVEEVYNSLLEKNPNYFVITKN